MKKKDIQNSKAKKILKFIFIIAVFLHINLFVFGKTEIKGKEKTVSKNKIAKKTDTKTNGRPVAKTAVKKDIKKVAKNSSTSKEKTVKNDKVGNKKVVKNTKDIKKSKKDIKIAKNNKVRDKKSVKDADKIKEIKTAKLVEKTPIVEEPKKPTVEQLNVFINKNLKLKKSSKNYDVKGKKSTLKDLDEADNFDKKNAGYLDFLEEEEEKIYVGNNQLGRYLYEDKDFKVAFFLAPEGSSYLEEEKGEFTDYGDHNDKKKEESVFQNYNKDNDAEKEIELSKGVGMEYKF